MESLQTVDLVERCQNQRRARKRLLLLVVLRTGSKSFLCSLLIEADLSDLKTCKYSIILRLQSLLSTQDSLIRVRIVGLWCRRGHITVGSHCIFGKFHLLHLVKPCRRYIEILCSECIRSL